jgi:hypothetical protein
MATGEEETNTETNTEITSNIFSNPTYIACDANYVWISNSDNSISRINKSDLSVLPISSSFFNNPLQICCNGETVWVKNHNDNVIVQIDAHTGFPCDSIILVNSSSVIPMNDGDDLVQEGMIYADKCLWLVNHHDNSVTRIDPLNSSLQNQTKITVGHGPCGIAFDGKYIWVSNSIENSVSQIDIQTMTMNPDKIKVGNYPIGIAVTNGRFVWVANWNDNTLSQIQIYENETERQEELPSSDTSTSTSTSVTIDNTNSVVINDGVTNADTDTDTDTIVTTTDNPMSSLKTSPLPTHSASNTKSVLALGKPAFYKNPLAQMKK